MLTYGARTFRCPYATEMNTGLTHNLTQNQNVSDINITGKIQKLKKKTQEKAV